MTAMIRGLVLLVCFGATAAVHADAILANVGPVAVDFGAVKMGATVAVPVTVQNLTTGTLGIAGSGISGTVNYTIDPSTCGANNYQVAPGGSCQFIFKFTPTDASGTPFTTTSALLIQAGAVNQAVQLSFSGSGNETLAQVTPVSIDFGNTFIGQQVTVPVTITNTHSATLNFSGGGTGSSVITGSTDCGNGVSPGSTCTVNYSFTPSAAGLVQASSLIGIATTNPTAMSQYFPITLKGTGANTLPSPNVATWPVGVDFGQIKVGHIAQIPFYFKNNGIYSVSLSGGGFNNDEIAFAGFQPSGAGCNSASYNPGITCASTYQFRPRVTQPHSAATGISFSDPFGTSFVSYNVDGTGVGTLARITPTIVDLGRVAFGTTMSVPVVITNTSDDPLGNFTGGQMNYPFSASNNCGTSLAVGASCAYTYTFTAPAAHDRIQARYTASTLLSFNNASNLQPIVPIQISAEVGDRIFGDDFGS